MTTLDSLREMFSALHEAEGLPAEVELAMPAPLVHSLVRQAHVGGLPVGVVAQRGAHVHGMETIRPWLRIYEPWGCIYIRTLEGK